MPFLPSSSCSAQRGRCHAACTLFLPVPCCWAYKLFCLLGYVEWSCYRCSCLLSPSARGSSFCFSRMFLFWALMCTTSAWRQRSSSWRTKRFNVLVVQPVPANTLTWRCPAGAQCPTSSAQWLRLEQCVGRAGEQRPAPLGWRPHYSMLSRNNTLPVLLVMLQLRLPPACHGCPAVHSAHHDSAKLLCCQLTCPMASPILSLMLVTNNLQQNCFPNICISKTFVLGWNVPQIPHPPGSSHGGLHCGKHSTLFHITIRTEHTQDCPEQWLSHWRTTYVHSYTPQWCFTQWPITSPKAQGGQATPGLVMQPGPTYGEGANTVAAEAGFSFSHVFCHQGGWGCPRPSLWVVTRKARVGCAWPSCISLPYLCPTRNLGDLTRQSVSLQGPCGLCSCWGKGSLLDKHKQLWVLNGCLLGCSPMRKVAISTLQMGKLRNGNWHTKNGHWEGGRGGTVLGHGATEAARPSVPSSPGASISITATVAMQVCTYISDLVWHSEPSRRQQRRNHYYPHFNMK